MRELILVTDDDDNEKYIDYWFSPDIINGYYMTDDNHLDKSVNITTIYGCITLKQTPTLTKFLLDKGW